jgi:hypothetical protein
MAETVTVAVRRKRFMRAPVRERIPPATAEHRLADQRARRIPADRGGGGAGIGDLGRSLGENPAMNYARLC